MDSNQPPDPSTPPPPPPPPPSGEPPAGGGSYQRPADYYAAPPAPEEKKGCPRWLLFGCGGLGCLGLLVLLAGGWWMMRGGGVKMMGFVISQLEKEADQLFAADVPQDERQRLKENLATLRGYIGEQKVELVALQPVITEIQGAINDQRLTREEVESLNESLEDLNESIASTPVSVRGGPPASRLRAA
ncbi:MAG: hypothetical protein ACRD2J_15915 [Thermoanaerobaculia bacterium]